MAERPKKCKKSMSILLIEKKVWLPMRRDLGVNFDPISRPGLGAKKYMKLLGEDVVNSLGETFEEAASGERN